MGGKLQKNVCNGFCRLRDPARSMHIVECARLVAALRPRGARPRPKRIFSPANSAPHCSVLSGQRSARSQSVDKSRALQDAQTFFALMG